MKKFFVFLLLVLLVPTMVLADTDAKSETLEETLKSEDIEYELGDYKEEDGRAKVYLFRGQGCSHCHEFLEYVASSLLEDYGEYFNLVSYEVWNNQANSDLMQEVSSFLGEDATGVPYIIIGDKTWNGYSESMNSEIESAIKDLYDSEEKYDVFSEMKKGSKKKTSKKNNSTTIGFIILASVVVVILIVKSIKGNS